jgi:hypothetical protein
MDDHMTRLRRDLLEANAQASEVRSREPLIETLRATLVDIRATNHVTKLFIDTVGSPRWEMP